MPEQRIQILCTRPVDNSKKEEARQKGITLDIIAFIETTPVQTIEIQQEVESAGMQQATVVFTSMNAADAVIDMLDGHIPEWRIYCMGHTTRQLVIDYFGEAALSGTADNASDLAEEIIENDDPEEVIFFCGNQRRDELPAKLEKHHIAVNEIVVYETIALEQKVEKDYDGVIFFSPSAVQSYFKQNQLAGKAVAFAIGSTTADAIRKKCGNKIVISRSPGKEELVVQALEYFSGK